MKSIRAASIQLLFFLALPFIASAARPAAGFYLPDSVGSMTLNYRVFKGLIVLPVTINDSVEVNLVLDTGCRNLILFGKRFMDRLEINSPRRIEFSGLGDGKPVEGRLSLGNKVSIHQVLGHEIPIVIAGDNSIFSGFQRIDGVIGYEIFLRFEIELNPSARRVTFRPGQHASPPHGYTEVPLRIVDARPVLESLVYVGKDEPRKFELMIDTGSTLGLLLKTTNIAEYRGIRNVQVLGFGFNGPVSGYATVSPKLKLQGLEMTNLRTGVVPSDWHNNASIGMQILKDYVLILNYSKQYACFKRNDLSDGVRS